MEGPDACGVDVAGGATGAGRGTAADADGSFSLQWCSEVAHWAACASCEVVVATSHEPAEAAARRLAECDCALLGLDTEWSASREVAVLQLASERLCLLCLMPEVQLSSCPTLLRLLADGAVVKAGVGIAQDAALLRNLDRVEVGGCCDLFLLAAREGYVPAARPCSLAHLTRLLTGVELAKSEEVRCANWAQRPLSAERLRYAALDALAGFHCAEELRRRASDRGDPESAESMAAWCGELLDRAPKLKGSAKDRVKPDPAQRVLSCGAYACVTKFGTRRIVDSDGNTLLHMKERSVEGLLRRGLASLATEDGEEVVRLKFTPVDHYDYAGLDAAERNACVSCGCSGVARYYVVPQIFFRHLPEQCKRYNCHDVVMLCPACRARAEPAQLARVRELLAQHGAVAAGSGFANSNSVDPCRDLARRAAVALLRPPRGGRKGRLPPEKEREFRATVATALGVLPEELSREHLERASAGEDGPQPSERVCAEACADAESLRAFLREWRELFVDVLKPRFLAEGWGVDTGLDGRFVPSVPSSLVWPGDWQCSSCGVHCFGRGARCRKCGAEPAAEDAASPPAIAPEPAEERPEVECEL